MCTVPLETMAGHGSNSFRPIVSSTRIMFGLLPGLGAIILLRLIIHLYRSDIEDADNRVKDYEFDELLDCYDFIVVGGGSAGAVTASRLSENPKWNILLLEAGSDENVLSDVPVMFPALQTSSMDWQFSTEPSDKYCLSMKDTRCKWPRGKVLGGSSTLNAMLYIRGNKQDYDNWASMGNEGWSYRDILKYFLKAEDMRIPDYQNDPYHATGGPLSVEYFRYEQPITSKILEAGQQLGYNILDVNGESQTGFTRSHATLRDGLRCSTAKAYLRSARKRHNLHISMHSLVEKVLIDEFKVAYGVKFTKHKQSHVIKASKEIIISAGAIQSPQLLILSGVGDSSNLKELGIYPIVNLPGVGKNLQDHVAMGGHSFLFDNPYTNGSDYCFNLNTVVSLASLIDFAINKNGPLYSMMEAEAMAFVNTKYQDPAEDYPDIQFFIAPTADNMDGGLFGKRANGLSDETYADLYEDILYDSSFSIVPLLLRPKSRGYIKLRDANPFSPPLIYPNYYTEPEDVLIMIEGARLAQMLVQQPALQALNARPNPNRNPGCAQHHLMSDEHLECQARHHTLTIYHPVGTCAMGPSTNSDAVVDSRLKVHGIKNLRIVDGSIMPRIVSGNTNAPIIMIAEKASDMIKEDWSLETTDSGICQTENNMNNYLQNIDNLDFENNIHKDIDVQNERDVKFRKVEESKTYPNVFTEMDKLFPNLPKDINQKYEKTEPEKEKYETAQRNDYKLHKFEDNKKKYELPVNPFIPDTYNFKSIKPCKPYPYQIEKVDTDSYIPNYLIFFSNRGKDLLINDNNYNTILPFNTNSYKHTFNNHYEEPTNYILPYTYGDIIPNVLIHPEYNNVKPKISDYMLQYEDNTFYHPRFFNRDLNKPAPNNINFMTESQKHRNSANKEDNIFNRISNEKKCRQWLLYNGINYEIDL